MENAEINYQKLFLENLKNSAPPNVNLAYEIADILGISNDAAYRRMRGEKPIGFNEIMKLCQHYHVGIDKYINDDPSEIKFRFMPLLDNFDESYMTYISSLRDSLKRIVDDKSVNKKVYFAATDIPIFYLCKFPELKAFKTFSWHKQFERDYQLKFSLSNATNSELINIFREISSLYDRIDSVEIWSHNTINSFLNLIQYYYEIDCFESTSDAIVLCDKILAMIEVLKNYGGTGSKPYDGGRKSTFNLLLSDTDLENNFIYAETDNIKVSFLKLYFINTISSTNLTFSDSTKRWFDSVINKSVLISGFSQKHFLLFFKEIINKVEALKQKLLEA